MSFSITSRRNLVLSALGTLCAQSFPVRAQIASPAPVSPVILTVAGLIDKPNRTRFDGERDRLFEHNNLTFERAHAFDSPALGTLPQQNIRTVSTTGEAVYTGPFLSDVLEMAGASPDAKSVRLSALDGYAAELPTGDVKSQKWVLAMAENGNAYGIGDYGPLRVVRVVSPEIARSDEEIQKWVYALYYIELMS